MKTLLVLLTLGSTMDLSARCRAKEFRCELRCNEDTKGGTMARLKCYERCREDEADCRKYGSDEP